MSTCVACGRELPALSTGELCPECGVRQPQAQLSSVSPSPTPRSAIRARRGFSTTTAIVGINIAVFVAMGLSGVSWVEPTVQQVLKWGANWGPLSLGTEPWRMLTSNYVHGGIFHIFFNMWCLWNLGKLAERIFDRGTYLLIYTATGLAGSLASLWWHPMVVGVGASGAIFGLAGALIAAFYLGRLPVPKEAIRATLKSLLIFAGYNLFFGAIWTGIDNSAHLGGLISGLALGAFLSGHLAQGAEVRARWRNYALVGVAIILVAGNVLVKHRFLSARPAQIVLQGSRKPNFDEIIPELQKAVQRQPKSAEAHYVLGLAYVGAQRPDEAIASFQEALRLNPDYAAAQEGLGVAYRAKGMEQEAQDAFNKAEQLRQKTATH